MNVPCGQFQRAVLSEYAFVEYKCADQNCTNNARRNTLSGKRKSATLHTIIQADALMTRDSFLHTCHTCTILRVNIRFSCMTGLHLVCSSFLRFVKYCITTSLSGLSFGPEMSNPGTIYYILKQLAVQIWTGAHVPIADGQRFVHLTIARR